MIAWFMLLLALFLPDKPVDYVSFLGIPSFMYLYDAAYLKEILFDLVRRRELVYKGYIIVKIAYWIIMYAHFIGCIFYLIDAYLISTEYFG